MEHTESAKVQNERLITTLPQMSAAMKNRLNTQCSRQVSRPDRPGGRTAASTQKENKEGREIRSRCKERKKERKKKLHQVQLLVQLRKPSVCASTPDELPWSRCRVHACVEYRCRAEAYLGIKRTRHPKLRQASQ
jgi:hypothetical protein